jgi:hypothetical protein
MGFKETEPGPSATASALIQAGRKLVQGENAGDRRRPLRVEQSVSVRSDAGTGIARFP